MQEQKYSIKQWAKDGRSSEKLLSKGPQPWAAPNWPSFLLTIEQKKNTVGLALEVLKKLETII